MNENLLDYKKILDRFNINLLVWGNLSNTNDCKKLIYKNIGIFSDHKYIKII